MKVKNVVFSGFMAAILSATGANAAISVASKAYVDKFVGEQGSVTTELAKKANATDVASTYATKEFVGSLEGKDAATIVEYIDDKTADIASGTAFSSLTGRVDAAEGKITALETLTGADGKIAKDIAQALTDAKGYADGKAADAQAAAEAKAATAQAAAEAADGKAVAAQAAANTNAAAITEITKEGGTIDTKAGKALADAKTYVDGQLGALSEGKISETQNKVAANEQAIEGLLDSVAAMDTAYKAADAGLDTAVKAAQADATQALADAAAASTAAANALTDAKKYADDQDAAQTTTITAAYELADSNLETTLKGYADDKASEEAKKEAKAVADTLKFLATAEVPDECLTGEDGSNMCVLTLTSTGTFAWTPLTTPVE